MEALAWARLHGAPTAAPEVVSDRPWALVTRLGDVWLKECRPVQRHEVPLTVALAARWPDRVPGVLAADAANGRLLLEDAGAPVAAFGDELAAWTAALPLYAELQQGETEHTAAHLAAGVPDLRPHTLPARYDAWVDREPRLAPFARRLAELCGALELPPTVQHDDLHSANLYARSGRITILDWGDTCIAHPLTSVFILFRVAEHFHGPDWLPTLRAAYAEPWGDVGEELGVAYVVGAFSRLLQWERMNEPEQLERNLEWFLENVVAA